MEKFYCLQIMDWALIISSDSQWAQTFWKETQSVVYVHLKALVSGSVFFLREEPLGCIPHHLSVTFYPPLIKISTICCSVSLWILGNAAQWLNLLESQQVLGVGALEAWVLTRWFKLLCSYTQKKNRVMHDKNTTLNVKFICPCILTFLDIFN